MCQSPPVLTGKPHPREVKRHGLGSHSKLVQSWVHTVSLLPPRPGLSQLQKGHVESSQAWDSGPVCSGCQ